MNKQEFLRAPEWTTGGEPLSFPVLIVIETTDIMFAVDSVPPSSPSPATRSSCTRQHLRPSLGLRALTSCWPGSWCVRYLKVGLCLSRHVLGRQDADLEFYKITDHWCRWVVRGSWSVRSWHPSCSPAATNPRGSSTPMDRPPPPGGPAGPGANGKEIEIIGQPSRSERRAPPPRAHILRHGRVRLGPIRAGADPLHAVALSVRLTVMTAVPHTPAAVHLLRFVGPAGVRRPRWSTCA